MAIKMGKLDIVIDDITFSFSIADAKTLYEYLKAIFEADIKKMSIPGNDFIASLTSVADAHIQDEMVSQR